MSYSTAFSQAIVTVVFVGDKVQQGLYEFVPTSAICKALNLKAPTLSKIIHSLIRANIFEAKEGKNGGVRLKRKPSDIHLLMIFEAIESEKPLFQTHLNLTASGAKPDRAKKELVRVLSDAEKSMKSSLKKEYIDEYIQKIGSSSK